MNVVARYVESANLTALMRRAWNDGWVRSSNN